MKSVVFGCHNPRGGMSHIQADYDGVCLSNFKLHSSEYIIFHEPIEISFCPDTEYLIGEYDFLHISDLRPYRKRTTAERQQNMFLIASQVQTIFKK